MPRRSSGGGVAAPSSLPGGATWRGRMGSEGAWGAAAVTGVGPAGSLHNVLGVM